MLNIFEYSEAIEKVSQGFDPVGTKEMDPKTENRPTDQIKLAAKVDSE